MHALAEIPRNCGWVCISDALIASSVQYDSLAVNKLTVLLDTSGKNAELGSKAMGLYLIYSRKTWNEIVNR